MHEHGCFGRSNNRQTEKKARVDSQPAGEMRQYLIGFETSLPVTSRAVMAYGAAEICWRGSSGGGGTSTGESFAIPWRSAASRPLRLAAGSIHSNHLAAGS